MPSSDRRALRRRRELRRRRAGAVLAVPVALAAWLLAAAAAFAASPAPSQAAVGDPRSSGAGPGLVGDPLFAVGAVALIAVVSLGVTLAYVRATRGRPRA